MALHDLDFLDATELADGTLIVAAQDRTIDMESEPHTVIAVRDPDGSWSEPGAVGWGSPGISANADGTGLVVASPEGEYLEYTLHGHTSRAVIEGIDEEAPPTSFAFAKVVQGVLYADGTRHHLHACSDGTWRRVESRALAASRGVQCFEGIAGFGPQEMYAFGWDGVMWSNAAGEWERVRTPTDRILHDGDVLGDRVVVGGQSGTILEGRYDDWRRVERPVSIGDIWAVRTFQDAVYFSTYQGVFRRTQDGAMALSAPLGPSLRTTGGLFVGPRGLWSIGRADIALFDGGRWQTVAQS